MQQLLIMGFIPFWNDLQLVLEVLAFENDDEGVVVPIYPAAPLHIQSLYLSPLLPLTMDWSVLW